MYRVKNFIQASSKAPVRSVALDKATAGSILYKIINFDSTETKTIHENAFGSGARFGPTLYYIAGCCHAIDNLNKQRNNSGDLWLPVPYDGRIKGAIGPLISNAVSFIFYRINANEMRSLTQTVKCLSNQMTAQIKDKMPAKYSMFMDMMRHIPLWLYYFLISKTGEGTFASFLYTSTGDNFKNMKTLFGEELSDIAMIPALTYPPGFTFVFLEHNDQLSINIAYSPDVISNNELDLIDKAIRTILLSGDLQ